MKIGVVGIPGKWSTEILADRIEQRTNFRLVVDMKEVRFDSASNTVFYNNIDLASLDGLIVKKVGQVYTPHMIDRLDLLTFIRNKGVPVFSDPGRIAEVVNRASCTIRLSSGGIPIPETVITENPEQALETLRDYGKAVLKPLYTSKARGMVLVENDSKAQAKIEEFYKSGNKIIYMQKFVNSPGKDLGLVFLGGEYVDTYARVSSGAWNTTTHSGGKYESYTPSDEIIDLAKRAQEIFALDFTSVDVVETDEGPLVFEVSAFGGFRGLKETVNIDAADLYAEFVYRSIKRNQ